MQTSSFLSKSIIVFVFAVALIALTRFTPLSPHWGSSEQRMQSTITVTGYAKVDKNNQIAQFNAGFEAINADKTTATNQVNQGMNNLLDQIKALGIEDKDIKTTQVSVYQETDVYEIGGRPEREKSDFRASINVTVKLRNLDLADQLLAVMQSSSSNQISGPNFMLDDEPIVDEELLSLAIANAKERAQALAQANNQKIGKMLQVSEYGFSPYPAYESAPMMGGMAKDAMVSANLAPGSSTATTNVSVTFELF
jgi:uncharacterized protein YggE